MEDVKLQALDALALALVEHKHTWTPEQRRLYEKATGEITINNPPKRKDNNAT